MANGQQSQKTRAAKKKRLKQLEKSLNNLKSDCAKEVKRDLKRSKGKVTGRIACFVIAIAAIVGVQNSSQLKDIFLKNSNQSIQSWQTQLNSEAEYYMEYHFIDVGQADACLILSNGQSMLIDTGNADDKDILLDYLQDKGVNSLDYMVLTHPHEDHIGSAAAILEEIPVEQIIMSPKKREIAIYKNLETIIKEKEILVIEPKLGEIYSFGTGNFQIIAPVFDDYEEEINNYSIGLMIENGLNRMITYGDGEKKAELDMLSTGVFLQADILKVSHHGSKTSSSQEILDEIEPKYSIISVGKDNKYGLPHIQPLTRLEETTTQLFRTDQQGTIVGISDGKNITWNQEPCNDFMTQ